jgi:ankyrin repeat protein
VPTVPLPGSPRVEQLRKQARDLQRAVRAGDAPALARVAEHHPAGAPAPTAAPRFALSAAQLVVARRYGFASWPRLIHHVAVVEEHTRTPGDDDASDGGARAVAPDPADEFLRLACLNYRDDGPHRWERARHLLGEHPDLGDTDVCVAAALADVDRVRRFLAEDPGGARREGGPHRWTPLCYLAYARHDPGVAEAAVLDTARALLDAGADPDAGYLWYGLPTPFTVLTGVFGEGELGPERQPAHPCWRALARLLLEAGADPNDGQALYNRMFQPGEEHLELLFAHGLGTGDGGPWRARLGPAVDSPEEMLRGQLAWAVVHDMRARVMLLVEHGVDVRTPLPDGRHPAEVAVLSGHRELADWLVAHGAAPPALTPVDAFVAAALDADRAAVAALQVRQPDVVAAARAARPGLVVWAAATRRADAVALLVELGFDVNAHSRSDVPVEQEWEAALHVAAAQGDAELVRLLLALGADPDRRDARFDATALGWAEYHGHPEVAALLAPVTGAGGERTSDPGCERTSDPG